MIPERLFTEHWVEIIDEVGDKYHPKGEASDRGTFLRDQALIFIRLLEVLTSMGVIEE